MAVVELERYQHPDPGFEIDLPQGVELGVMPGMVLVARLPLDESRSPFRGNLTIVAQELPAGVDVAAHGDASLAEEARSLPNWRLIDRAPAEVGGLPAERTLATYRLGRDSGIDAGRALSVTVEQWRLLRDGLAWIVSVSCESSEYGLFCDLWTACAESLRPGEAA